MSATDDSASGNTASPAPTLAGCIQALGSRWSSVVDGIGTTTTKAHAAARVNVGEARRLVAKQLGEAQEVLRGLQASLEAATSDPKRRQVLAESAREASRLGVETTSVKDTLTRCLDPIRKAGSFAKPNVGKTLEEMARRLGLEFQCDEEAGASAGAGSQTMFLSCAAFFIEVNVGANQTPTVSIGHGEAKEQEDPAFAALLSSGDFASIERGLGWLIELYALAPQDAQQELYKGLVAVEAALCALAPAQDAGPEARLAALTQGPGWVTPRDFASPMSIAFYASARDTKRAAAAAETGPGDDAWATALLKRCRTAVLVLEPCEGPGTLPLPPQAPEAGDGQPASAEATGDGRCSKLAVRPVLHLSGDGLPAFPATVEAITALGAVADSPGPGLTSSTEVTPGIDMLHALLGQQHGAEGDQGTQAAPVVSLGHPFRCTVQVNTTAEQRGMSLARVPLPHPQQLLPALQILRRQAVYNELFCSCLPQASASLSPGAQGLTIEVMCSSPFELTVFAEHPDSGQLFTDHRRTICHDHTVSRILHPHTFHNTLIVDLHVGMEGVEAAVSVPDGSQPLATAAQATEIFRSTLSVPLGMALLCRCTPAEPPSQEAAVPPSAVEPQRGSAMDERADLDSAKEVTAPEATEGATSQAEDPARKGGRRPSARTKRKRG